MKIKIMMVNGLEIDADIIGEELGEFVDEIGKSGWLTIGEISIRQENILTIQKIKDAE